MYAPDPRVLLRSTYYLGRWPQAERDHENPIFATPDSVVITYHLCKLSPTCFSSFQVTMEYNDPRFVEIEWRELASKLAWNSDGG